MIKSSQITKLIRLAIEEDLYPLDITTEIVVPQNRDAKAKIVTKERAVVCGTSLIDPIFREYGSKCCVTERVQEGDEASPGTFIATISSDLRSLLSLERIVLNFIQRLSGIATNTKEIAQKTDTLLVCDTRKTTPGWRLLEKYAVKVGGARNHRFSLGDLVLIKDNHITACGGSVAEVLQRAKNLAPIHSKIEIEISNLDQLKEAIPHAPDIIMLDNMGAEEIREALKLVREASKNTTVEVSGNITASDLKELEKIGVDCVSMGRLTYGARVIDMSMKIE
ncbi:MAG: carboxylating nicotinate-nucleotide diphosphorylase [Candidatus Dadabacteria bacterium]|nr:MAG: carboxylating nicotinate-nucleotide diphosphorylase [Candidatus Dadabacteria bacterium]